PSHTPLKNAATTSQYLYSATPAATKAAIPATTRPMGLASSAELSSHWAAAMSFAPAAAVFCDAAIFSELVRNRVIHTLSVFATNTVLSHAPRTKVNA